ncbi:hypothetical protein ACFXKW_20795 [Streptomyces sp. NPDC059193]|uniref:hypothetical protein n=1 Tax=Streptomyces sp. NPDC059193 TaxID=3346763 RepID=UPI0036A6DD15
MITVDGRAVLSRADMHQQYGYAMSTLENWWADRAANAHPDVVHRIGHTLYWDAEEWQAWDRDRQGLEVPEGWLTRDALAAAHRLSRSHLAKLWAERDTNGHPEPVRYGGIMHWDSAAWGTWHQQHQAQAADRRRPEPPAPAHAHEDPNELIGPAEFGRLLGQKGGSWVTRAVAAPPAGFPAPDEWGDPETRKRPKWRRGRALKYAHDRTQTAPARPGRPKGARTGSRPYASDTRLSLARQSLTDHPDDTNAQHIERLQQQSAIPASASAWTKILQAARKPSEE